MAETGGKSKLDHQHLCFVPETEDSKLKYNQFNFLSAFPAEISCAAFNILSKPLVYLFIEEDAYRYCLLTNPKSAISSILEEWNSVLNGKIICGYVQV